MKNLTKFLTVFLLALLGANLQPAWASGGNEGTSITFYAIGSMFDGWNNSTSTLKVDVRRKGDKDDWNTYGNAYLNADMTNTGMKYHGYTIYSYTFKELYDGAQIRLKHYQGSTWKADYDVNGKGDGAWRGTNDLQGKIYLGWHNSSHVWVSYYADHSIAANSTVIWDLGTNDHTWSNVYMYRVNNGESGTSSTHDTYTRISSTNQWSKTYSSAVNYMGVYLFRSQNGSTWNDYWSTTDIYEDIDGVTLFTYDGTDNNKKLNWHKTSGAKKLTSGKKIYFDNTDSKWSAIYLKYGTQWFNRYLKYTMTKVTGTDNLYVAQMPNDAYCAKWYLADHYGYTNYHNIETYTDITNRTHTQTSDLSSDITFVPSSKDNSSPKVWETSTFSGHTRTVTITTPTNGSIKVTYTDENGTSQTKNSESFSVAQTCIITVTATGNDGYHLKSLSVGGASFSSGETYIVRAATTISATFEETKHTAAIAYMCGSESIKDATTSNPAGIVTYAEIAAPEIPGYTFVNWSTLPNGATLKTGDDLSNATINVNLSKDGLTLTANYTVDKTMYTYAFGRVTGMTDAMGTVSSSPSDASLEAGTEITVTASPKTGYEVEGWYSDQAGNNKIVGAGTTNPYVFSIAGNTTVYVKFQETKYTVNVAEGTGVSSVSPASVQVGQINASENITATPATGYELDGWTLGTGITIVEGTKSPIKIKATQAGTITAKAKAKTYTISFDQNGGTGGQTATVTATYDQPMPTLSEFTAPTRVGYKFKGYYSAATDGTKYYNADGTATANTWTNDAVGGTATIYAQWQQLYCFIEGRFSVATSKARTDWKQVASSFGEWDENSTRIKMDWDSEKNCYKLVTWATLKDLTDKQKDQYQFFSIKQSESSTALVNAVEYMQETEGNLTLSDKDVKKNWVKHTDGNVIRPHFDAQDKTGYVIIYFNETQLWYELEEFATRNITVNHGLGGNVDPSGTIKVGEVSWEVKATAGTGYYFKRWTASDANIHFEDATQPTTKITATGTGDGSITANFVAGTRLYFQKPNNWADEVWVYFYGDDGYWVTEETDQHTQKGAGAEGYTGHQMTEIGTTNTFYLDYDPSWAHKGIAFVNAHQDGQKAFYNTSVSYRTDFNHCSVNNWFIPDNNVTGYYNKYYDGSNLKQTAYYNDGYWTSYTYLPVGYFLKNSRGNWEPLDEYHFQDTEDASVKRLVVKNVNQGDQIAFKIWQTCACEFGVGATGCIIKEDTKNYGINTGNEAITLQAWKTGSYEFVLYTKTNSLDVTYLGDITVANFPEEVSTFKDRQHKIKPDVTLRNGTTVNDVTITVNGYSLPWTSTHATYEQNGTNLVITGNAIGTDDNLTVRYQNNKQPTPYIVERTLKVNVATPIVIQAMLKKDEDGQTDDYWSKTGLVHIHFWGTDATKTQDMDMSYNKDTKVFSVTAPKIDGFSFMFWYGEDINQSASEQWRKTNDITDCTTNTCYSISYGKDNNTKRTATPKTGLCTTGEYYVEITMKNGNTYKSNTISNLSKEVSFFAPKSNDDTYTGGTVRIVHNGVVSDPITGFATAGVYVAQIANGEGFVANSIKPYTGKYYIRTDGAGGMWNDYKTDDDNVMIEFTPRAEKGETFSYYWVKNVAKTGTGTDGKVNVKADVANDINDNLAGMIENDKFTDGGGYVYNSTNGANVRFSYEPTTNEFKRAIISGSGDNNFLNIYSNDNNLFADAAKSKQLNANADLTDSKFNDVSDWVYEKVVYVYANGSNPSNVILKSVYNGQTTHLLGYEINEDGEETDEPKPLEVMGSQSQGDFALRITYDYKKNRLMASWEPGNLVITTNTTIDSDVLFVQTEGTNGTIDDIDVAQITYADTEDAHKAKLTSLKNMMYILEVTSKTIENTAKDNQEYWITLPFDCRVSDVFGVEDYVKLDANGNAISGTWGILRYDGATRASHGWISESENYWKWMTRDETMKAGLGYVVVFDKTNAGSWPSIGVEEPCEGETDGCKEGKKTVQKRIKRLYFPSIGTQFEISYSGNGSSVQYDNNPCSVKGREELDNNWKVLGPVSYNNIGVQSGLTFYYDYVQSNEQGNRYVSQTVTGGTILKAFHGYMTQFGGTLTWQPFTKSDDVTGKAPLYAVAESEFKGGMLTVELNNAQGTQLDRTFVNLHKNGTLGFDQNMELTKITENCAQIASISEDVLYAGSTLPLDIELVPLNVKVVANGTYDIALEKSLKGLEVNLFDAFEQTTTPLDMMSATVTLNKGEYKDRFYLQLKQKSGETPTSFEGKIEQYNLPTDKTQKLLINGNIYLINGGRIYNVLGVEE